MIDYPSELTPVTDYLLAKGCYPVIVGGYLRDSLLGLESKDIDIEVYVVKDIETLQTILERFGPVNLVGKSFGVLKLRLDLYEIDFSLPRKESKTTQGHRGFNVTLSGQMDFMTAALRRDFTINAMGYAINSSLLLDPYGGQKDLQTKTLRCVDPKTFVEDPLRVLRAVQMCGRFDLRCDEKLVALCREMVDRGQLDELPKERLFEEIRKLLLKAQRPSLGLKVMREMHLLDFFVELRTLIGVHQKFSSDLRDDVWEHTLSAVDAMAEMRTDDDKRDLTLMLAVLCHDFGKSYSTDIADDQWHIPEHEEAGISLALSFLGRITDEKQLKSDVIRLIRHHAKPLVYYQRQVEDAQLRRLALDVPLQDLLFVAKADFLGHDTKEARTGCFPAEVWFVTKAVSLDILDKAPTPLLHGRDLITEGLRPSPVFKEILDKAFEAQLDGEFSTYEEAKHWLSAHLS